MKIIMSCERVTKKKNVFISLINNTSSVVSRKGSHHIYINIVYVLFITLQN